MRRALHSPARIGALLTVAALAGGLAACGGPDDGKKNDGALEVQIYPLDTALPFWIGGCFYGWFGLDSDPDEHKVLSEKTYDFAGTVIEERSCAPITDGVASTEKRADGDAGLQVTQYVELTADGDGRLASGKRWPDATKSGDPYTLVVTRAEDGRVQRVESDQPMGTTHSHETVELDENEVIVKRTVVSEPEAGDATETVTTYTPDASLFEPDVYEETRGGAATERSVREAGGDVVVTKLIAEAWRETSRTTPLADAPLYDGHTVYTDYADDGTVRSVEETTLTIEGDAVTSVTQVRNAKGETYESGKSTGKFGRALIVRSHGQTLVGRVMQVTHEERETKGARGTTKETLDTTYGDDERVLSAIQTRSFDAAATKVEGDVTSSSCLPELLCLHDPEGVSGAYALSAGATYTYDDDGRMTAAEVTEFTGAERSAAGTHQEFRVERTYATP